MDSSVKIEKTVYDKQEFQKIVDRDIKTFRTPTVEEDQDTPEELFRLYDKLYYVIDVEGETNSHEYLVKKSSELITFEQSTEEIQPLLDEIAQLRAELLLANQQIIELETQNK